MKIGIFGGTFDPPHLAHLNIAESALQEAKLDKIIFIPASVPPHKNRPDISNETDRLKMTELLTKNNPYFEVSDIELNRQGMSYTYITLRELKQQYPSDNLHLLIGADMAMIFDTWKNAEEIIDIAPPLIAARPGYKFAKDFGTELPEKLSLKYRKLLKKGIFHIKEIDLSSTKIRKMIANHETSVLSEYIPAEIMTYIINHNLYNINR